MILQKDEIPKVIDKVKAAFPNLTNWEYNNKVNNFYSGFSVWGEYIAKDPNDKLNKTHFYVTFSVYNGIWTGTLSAGKPAYHWSSTDFGDAYLLQTKDIKVLAKAITALKRKIDSLFKALSVD